MCCSRVDNEVLYSLLIMKTWQKVLEGVYEAIKIKRGIHLLTTGETIQNWKLLYYRQYLINQ
jgi:hypothetical protein